MMTLMYITNYLFYLFVVLESGTTNIPSRCSCCATRAGAVCKTLLIWVLLLADVSSKEVSGFGHGQLQHTIFMSAALAIASCDLHFLSLWLMALQENMSMFFFMPLAQMFHAPLGSVGFELCGV